MTTVINPTTIRFYSRIITRHWAGVIRQRPVMRILASSRSSGRVILGLGVRPDNA